MGQVGRHDLGSIFLQILGNNDMVARDFPHISLHCYMDSHNKRIFHDNVSHGIPDDIGTGHRR